MKRPIDDINSIMDELVTSVDGQNKIIAWQEEFRNTFETSKDPVLWVKLIAEEAYEFMEELFLFGRSDNLLKEYCDVIYVTEGLIANSIDRSFLQIDQKTHCRLDDCSDVLQDVYRLGQQFFTVSEIIEGFHRVHLSNMSKLDSNGKVLRRKDGKVLKSDQYEPADMKGILDNEQDLRTIKNRLK